MPPEIAAEAAVWVARLHGPARNLTMERECLVWQARSAAHRLAFEKCTDTWQDVAGLKLSTYAGATAEARQDGGAPGPIRRRALVAAAALGGAVCLAVLLPAGQRYETGVGEQRVIVLADGTRMTLNTATEVRTDLTKAQRSVHVRRGEALFEVAKDASRPFVVQVAEARVVATGTEFVVRASPPSARGIDSFGVTLIEGQVIVQRSLGAAAQAPVESIVMVPGQRVVAAAPEVGVSSAARPRMRIDRPKVDQVVAWTRGDVAFDSATLTDAVDEVNRYSRRPIRLVGLEALGALRISGVYRTGDGESFARAVAALHNLAVRAGVEHLELVPRQP